MVGALGYSLQHRESMLISKGQEEFAGREKTSANRADNTYKITRNVLRLHTTVSYM